MKYFKYCSASPVEEASFSSDCGNRISVIKKKRFRTLASIAWALALCLYLSCARLPIKYSIGKIDNRFHISQDEMASLSKDAASRWNRALGKEVLVYDANAPLEIDLVYDERQANLDTLRTEISGLNLANSDINSTKQQLEDMIAEYERDLEKYNRDVEYWNSIGGAPKGTYQMLQNEKLHLEDRRENLTRAIELLDSSIETYNKDLADLQNELKEKEGKVEKRGVYKHSANRIDIYTFGNRDELRLVLMHELGHALGAGHTKNPRSIMYRLVAKQNFKDPRPLKEDIDAVEKGL